MQKLRTSEYVSPLHPDKICDRISDSILDELLAQDPESRVAVETMGGHGIITVTGEVTSKGYVDVQEVVKRLLPNKDYGVQVNIVRQSPEIAQGVDSLGAGDQGVMVGYATSETSEYLPLEHIIARKLGQYIFDRYPQDGKVQITMVGDEVTAVVCSWANVQKNILQDLVLDWLITSDFKVSGKLNYYINPAGDWNISQFDADTGLTGRKLAIDNYGTSVPLGGGCFSGKDSTKVDRSGAYKARQLAVRKLNETGAKEVYCYLAYAIGVQCPVDIHYLVDGVYIQGTEHEECTPQNIIKDLKLKEPQFLNLATKGHFGTNQIWDLT